MFVSPIMIRATGEERWLLEVFDLDDADLATAKRHAVWLSRQDGWRWWCCCGRGMETVPGTRLDLIGVLTSARMHFDALSALSPAPVDHPIAAWTRVAGEAARDDVAVAGLARRLLADEQHDVRMKGDPVEVLDDSSAIDVTPLDVLVGMLESASSHSDRSLVPAALDRLLEYLDRWSSSSPGRVAALFEQLDPSRLVRAVGQTLLASTRLTGDRSVARQDFLVRFLADLRTRGTPEAIILRLQKGLDALSVSSSVLVEHQHGDIHMKEPNFVSESKDGAQPDANRRDVNQPAEVDSLLDEIQGAIRAEHLPRAVDRLTIAIERMLDAMPEFEGAGRFVDQLGVDVADLRNAAREACRQAGVPWKSSYERDKWVERIFGKKPKAP